jgi:isoquinoline 1-oxidoreductase beta subunit
METLTPPTSRRSFLKAGGLLAIGFSLPGTAANLLHKLDPSALELEITPFILLTKEGKIILFNTSPDMGQGSWQAVPTLLAEELEVTLDMVEIRPTMGHPKHRQQFSGGSSSIRGQWESLRKAGAAAREMLSKAAATQWKVPESECYAEKGKIYHKPTKRSLEYGALAEEAAKLEVPKEPKLKTPEQFKLIGKSLPRPEVPSKVNGTAIFGIDVNVPDMLYASIAHSPVIHGKIISIDDTEALKIKGVKKVIKSERKLPHKTVEVVAVLADTYWAALKGRKALKINWDRSSYGNASTDAYFAQLRELAQKPGNPYKGAKGDVDKAFAGAAKKLEASYETPFAAHAMIEPENAVAWVQGNKVEIWAPNQSPDWLSEQTGKYLDIPRENVTVHTTFMGGSFGRKGYFDFVMEAIALSKQAGVPVKLLWTREDDLTQGPFRPGMLNALRAGLDEKGNVIAFEHKVVGGSIQGQTGNKDMSTTPDDWCEETISEEDSPYNIPNRRQSSLVQPTDIPIVWWRSVYSSTNAYAHESFIDELAHAAGKDPLQFRIDLLAEAPRFRKLLTFLKEKSGYQLKPAAGKAMGVAIARSFGSIAAYAITVSKAGQGVKIDKVIGVIDCGMTVNPDNVKAQTEGNVVMALSAALKPGITLKNGEVEQTNYHQYQVLRLNETPSIEIHVMPSTDHPGGAGEPGLPPVAPALCNAIFNLTGKRIRTLPFLLEEV